jgi:hypothetical protein
VLRTKKDSYEECKSTFSPFNWCLKSKKNMI